MIKKILSITLCILLIIFFLGCEQDNEISPSLSESKEISEKEDVESKHYPADLFLDMSGSLSLDHPLFDVTLGSTEFENQTFLIYGDVVDVFYYSAVQSDAIVVDIGGAIATILDPVNSLCNDPDIIVNKNVLRSYYPIPEIGEVGFFYGYYIAYDEIRESPCFIMGSLPYLEETLLKTATFIDEVEETEDTQQEEANSSPNYFFMGDHATSDNITVTLSNVYQYDEILDETPGEGNVFIVCEFEIQNDSANEIRIPSNPNMDFYVDQYRIDYDFNPVHYLNIETNCQHLYGNIDSGMKSKGCIGLIAPKSWNEIVIKWEPNFWNGKYAHFYFENQS